MARAKGAKEARATAERPRETADQRLGREAFISLFLASGRLTAEVEKLCRQEQITMSHYTVLWFLARRPEPEGVPMRAVIDGQLNRASDSTRLADRLTSLGFIERSSSAGDRRVVLVRLTEAGREVYERLTEKVHDLHGRQWSALSRSELKELRRLLAKVLWGDNATADAVHPLAAGDRSRGPHP